jgi:hypothetical protein
MENGRKRGTSLRRPTKIIILNQVFKIEWVSSGDDHGSVDLNNCVIQLVKTYPKKTICDTLIHEIIHAVNHVMGVGDKTSEEETTSRLSTGLCTVWTHNPKVFEWIHKQLTA